MQPDCWGVSKLTLPTTGRGFEQNDDVFSDDFPVLGDRAYDFGLHVLCFHGVHYRQPLVAQQGLTGLPPESFGGTAVAFGCCFAVAESATGPERPSPAKREGSSH